MQCMFIAPVQLLTVLVFEIEGLAFFQLQLFYFISCLFFNDGSLETPILAF